MLYRTLGRTGARVSALGVGGHHLGDLPTVDEAIRLVHEAIDAGITFFDNCWEYYNGKTENILRRALKGRRDKVFLMTKVCTHGRDKKVAMQQLEESLKRRRPADPARRRGRGGSIALRNEPACGYHDQRHRLPGGAPPEPDDRARLQADDTRGNAGAPPALRLLCWGRASGAVQIDQ